MGIANAAEADGHAFVARGGLGAIGSEKAVPPGEVKAEVAVVFLNHDRVVHAVHLRRNHEQPQHTINAVRQADVAVVEHAGRIEQNLKEDDRGGGCSQQKHCGHLDSHGQKNLHRVKTDTGSHVKIKIRVVNPVETPAKRHCMKHEMLQVNNEIEAQNAESYFEPLRQHDAV